MTADETDAAEKHLQWLGIRHYFSEVIGTDLVDQGKPFPDMVLLACERLAVEPARIAVIGDTNGDMRMAKAAGVQVAIGLADSEDNMASTYILPHADLIVQSYAELRIEVTSL